MDEICAGVEIYYTGRTGGQYIKTAFILCDDYTELIAKLFLLTNIKSWSDEKSKDRYKNYYDIMEEVENEVKTNLSSELSKIQALQSSMKTRRKRRNDFFHSTKLLDLGVAHRNCIESFCDLFEYGEILFQSNWRNVLEATRNLETFEVLFKLENSSFSDPSITTKVNEIFQEFPRNTPKKYIKSKGINISGYPEDIHLNLCVRKVGKELCDKLKALLPRPPLLPLI